MSDEQKKVTEPGTAEVPGKVPETNPETAEELSKALESKPETTETPNQVSESKPELAEAPNQEKAREQNRESGPKDLNAANISRAKNTSPRPDRREESPDQWRSRFRSPVPGDNGGTPGSPTIHRHSFREGFVTGMIVMMLLCFLVIGGAWAVRNYGGSLSGGLGSDAAGRTETDHSAETETGEKPEAESESAAAGSGESNESASESGETAGTAAAESGTAKSGDETETAESETAEETKPSDLLSGEEEAFGSRLENQLAEIDKLIDEHYIFSVSADTIYDNTVKGYIAGLGDPYSEYFTPEEYAETMNDSSGSYVGIGVAVQQDSDTGAIRALTVYSGSPADKAGMQSGDIITAVDGTDITSSDLDKVVTLIRGKAGSKVQVTVYRDGKYLDLTMQRAKVDKVTVTSKMLDETIGYIQLTEFDSVSADQLKDAVDQLRSQGMTSFVLDLRDDPGGLLTSVTDIADLFLPKGDGILYMMDKQKNRTDYKCKEAQYITEPVVVLVNGNTASAAEVLSGALRDNGRAQIVGTQTFGKGIVQTFFPLSDGSAVKLTTAHYFTPGGTDIHGVGIKPDTEISDDVTTDADEPLEAAEKQLKTTAETKANAG